MTTRESPSAPRRAATSGADSQSGATLEPSVPNAVPQARAARAGGYQAGDVLAGKYELLRALGQGGMAAVWVVQNLVLDAQFALKLLRQADGDAHAAERMLREARMEARIEHPAILRVFDFGVTNRGDPFLVTELLSGPTLRERLLREGRMTPVEAVRLLLPVADAISAAHSLGVVHRDLKPDNIVCVTESAGRCQPKIIDFGIAQQAHERSLQLASTGTVLGSPEYMSPEQARGAPDVDDKTDIWAFSVMLYELVTGTTPFLRDGALASVLHAITEEPPSPLADFGIHDPELGSIIALGLQKFPAGRWSDMRSMGTALAEWLLGQGVEEDVCAQSLRIVWLGRSSSAPPMVIDHHADEERARLSALAEDCEVPKRSILTTTLGVAAAAVTITFIGVAAFFTVGASRDVPVDTRAAQGAAPRSPEGQLARGSPAMGAPSPSLPSVSRVPIAAPSAATPGAAEPTPLACVPAVQQSRESGRAAAYQSLVAGSTRLPGAQAPQEFGGIIKENPYDEGSGAGHSGSIRRRVGRRGASDNPY